MNSREVFTRLREINVELTKLQYEKKDLIHFLLDTKYEGLHKSQIMYACVKAIEKGDKCCGIRDITQDNLQEYRSIISLVASELGCALEIGTQENGSYYINIIF